MTRHASMLKTLAEAGPEFAKFDKEKVGLVWSAMDRESRPVADAAALGGIPEGSRAHTATCWKRSRNSLPRRVCVA